MKSLATTIHAFKCWQKSLGGSVSLLMGIAYGMVIPHKHITRDSLILCRSSESMSSEHHEERLKTYNITTKHPSLTIQQTSDHGRGIFCNANELMPGSVIVRVPGNEVLTADNITSSDSNGYIYAALQLAGLDHRGVLALWLILEKLKGDMSEWSDYISQLPSLFELSSNHVLLSGDPLKGTTLGVSADLMRRNIKRQITMVIRGLRELGVESPLITLSPSDTEDLWTWAHTIVLTRSGIANTGCVHDDWTQYGLSIVPFVDFANHSDHPNARVQLDSDGSVELITISRIRKGEEVRISYWGDRPLTSEQSLFSFGFPSGHERYVLPDIEFCGAESDPRKAIQRLLFLDGRRTSSDNDVYVDDLDTAITYFAVEGMDETALNRLTRAYVSEGTVGPVTREILSTFKGIGQLKLLHVLKNWEAQLGTQTACSNRLLGEYVLNLKTHIQVAIKELTSRCENS